MPAAPTTRFAWLVPIGTVFISSLCIMVVELVAGRLIARHVGSSLYTWTSVIGIVLGGIAAGNFVGGLIADRYKAKEALASLFLVASAACLTIPLLNDRIGAWMFLRELDWALRIALHVFLVFFPPSAVLGMISPVAAKLALELGTHTGRTIGSVYSWGAIGSIVGTFFTGYFLIAQMGTVAVLLSVSAVLLLVSLYFGSGDAAVVDVGRRSRNVAARGVRALGLGGVGRDPVGVSRLHRRVCLLPGGVELRRDSCGGGLRPAGRALDDHRLPHPRLHRLGRPRQPAIRLRAHLRRRHPPGGPLAAGRAGAARRCSWAAAASSTRTGSCGSTPRVMPRWPRSTRPSPARRSTLSASSPIPAWRSTISTPATMSTTC